MKRATPKLFGLWARYEEATMAKKFQGSRAGANGGFAVSRPGSDAPRTGRFWIRRRDIDEQVDAVLNGSTIAPTDVYATRGDEILKRLRERTS